MKRIMAIALFAALTAQAATITSTEGKAVEADVLSYEDGVFMVRRAGKVYAYPEKRIACIEFASSAPVPKSDIKVDIRKVSIHFDDGYHDRIYLRPTVSIDFRTMATDYEIRPVVEVVVLVERRTSGSLEVCKMFYAWDKGWERFRFSGRNKTNIAQMSIDQPQCDLQKISPASLAKRNEKVYEIKDGFVKTPKILAYKVFIWLDGKVIAETEKIKTSKPIPKDWIAI